MYLFQVEICTGAMFMRLVWGLDIYLATIVLLTVIGIYAITDEVTITMHIFILTPKLSSYSGVVVGIQAGSLQLLHFC